MYLPTLLLYSRSPGCPNTYSIYIPRYRLSNTSSGTSTPLLSTSSVPITVIFWIPFAVSTPFHSKQVHYIDSPAPSQHSQTSPTHTQGLNIQYPNHVVLTTTPTQFTAEQLSTAISSLPENISATFPHPASPQPPQVTTQPTPLCKMSQAWHAFIATLPPSEQYFLGCYTFSPGIQHFAYNMHSNKFSFGIRQFSTSPTWFLHISHL